jgi:hypothetical protein
MSELLNICPVCGFDKLLEPPYSIDDCPSYEICSCCGFEYGYDDADQHYSFEGYREKWIKNGYEFTDEDDKPTGWNEQLMREQLKNTLKVNYKPRI